MGAWPHFSSILHIHNSQHAVVIVLYIIFVVVVVVVVFTLFLSLSVFIVQWRLQAVVRSFFWSFSCSDSLHVGRFAFSMIVLLTEPNASIEMILMLFGTVCEQFFSYKVQVYFNDTPRQWWRLWRLFTCRVSDVEEIELFFPPLIACVIFSKEIRHTHTHDRFSVDVRHFSQLSVDIMCYLKWCVNLPGIKMKIIFYYIIRRLTTVFYFIFHALPAASFLIKTSKFLFS